MSTTATSPYKTVKKIKAPSFDPQKLPSYSLCIQVGVRDFQVCIVNKQTNACIVLLDYKLEAKTIKTRLDAIKAIFAANKLLMSPKWEDIKISFKTHKFSLVPASHFLPDAASDYLAVNSEIKTKIESVYYYKHIASNAVNVFTTDKKVLDWLKQAFPNKSMQIVHQGSALIEGVLTYDDHSHEKAMFAYFDRAILHLVVTQNQKLLYYNQFAVRKPDDYLKYAMLVFRELGLSQKTSKLVVWGHFRTNSQPVELLKKYIRNISLGSRPNFLKLPPAFAELEEHRYFDLYSIFLCE